MSREIKFRAWDTVQKKFLDEIPPEKYMLDTTDWAYPDEDYLMVYPSNPLDTFDGRIIYQQYTGLMDKNNKEIFEGDIIENHNFIGVCEFLDGRYYLREIKAKIPMFCTDDINTFSHRIIGALCWDTVIGNIFENPELLENE